MNIKTIIINTLKKYQGFSLDNHQHVLMLSDILYENISSMVESKSMLQEDIELSVGFRDFILNDIYNENCIGPIQLELCL